MGEVYAAYHPDLDRRIALKVVHDAGAAADRRARLLREARAIARLSHPNVIAVHDAGTVDDRVYIAMEFVEGETVNAWLRAQARSWREVVDVFIAAGRGLAAAHAAILSKLDPGQRVARERLHRLWRSGNRRVVRYEEAAELR